MVHRLWNILEGEGYSVGGEVRVVPAKRKKLRKWTLITDRKSRIVKPDYNSLKDSNLRMTKLAKSYYPSSIRKSQG